MESSLKYTPQSLQTVFVSLSAQPSKVKHVDAIMSEFLSLQILWFSFFTHREFHLIIPKYC